MKPYTLTFFFICIVQVVSFSQQKPATKFSQSLETILQQKHQGEIIEVMATVRDVQAIMPDSVTILSSYRPANSFLIRLSVSKLIQLAERGSIVFADLRRQPKDELTTGSLDISLNKLRYLHQELPNINGDSVFVSLKEQRFDTTDIDLKNRWFETGVAAPVSSTHASIMATILAGGGNTSLLSKGAAWGAFITSSDYASLLPDADALYQQNKLSVQNHSYGTGIENFYGTDAVAYDMTVKNTPVLVHVFSAGNSGTQASASGPYSAIQGLANLTGSFKMAKNIITVGATDSTNQVAAASSKGPAYDGRVKPELVAFGEDGSSGAAALVSGTAALVQQAYKKSHGNALPSAALVRAILLNSADDIGGVHVDFSTGFGSLNAFQAVNTIKENRFQESSLTQGEVKTFSLTVPSGIKQLKCMLTWTDPPAPVNSVKALVNDLDALLVLPAGGSQWQPWVLNHASSRDSLLLPAKRGIDTLNNVEQITVDLPDAGVYSFQVKGTKVQQAVQSFAFTYQFDTLNEFHWTYPVSSTPLLSGTTAMIRWETTTDDTATIEYSFDGAVWKTVANGVSLQPGFFRWSVPDTLANARLRMRTIGSSFISNSFTISPAARLEVGFDCVDSFLLFWKRQSVSSYQLYQLGDKYMQPVLLTPDSAVVLQKNQHPSFYYAVAPMVNGQPGQRSYTINYATQGVGCYFRNFLVTIQNSTVQLNALLGTTYNISSVSFQKLTPSGFQLLQSFQSPMQVALGLTDPAPSRGLNRYRAMITLANGSIIYSSYEDVYYFPDLPVIVYPNPVRQNQPIRIAALEAGVYTIEIFDAAGRKVFTQLLNDLTQQIAPFRLGMGLYFVRISGGDTKPVTQKLVVY